jgi:hypothetical protein
MPVKLKIPERYVSPLAEFLRLTPGDLRAFMAALREQRPTLGEASLAHSLEARLSMGGTKVQELVRLLASLYVVQEQRGEDVGDFVAELRAAAERSGKPDLQIGDWTAYQEALIEALSADTALAVAAKASGVMNDHARVYCHSRILTDLRPIFESNIEHSPAAVVAVHTLKIVYHEGGEHKEFFVAMDRLDAMELSAHLERAFKKEDALKTLSEGNGFLFLESTS